MLLAFSHKLMLGGAEVQSPQQTLGMQMLLYVVSMQTFPRGLK